MCVLQSSYHLLKTVKETFLDLRIYRQFKLQYMKNVLTRRLLWVDADAVIGDDGAGGRLHAKLLRRELQHRCERRRFRHA